MRGAEVCGGAWRALKCLSGRRNVVLAVGWVLAIPMYGSWEGRWVGSTPPRHPPTTPPRVPPLPHHLSCTTLTTYSAVLNSSFEVDQGDPRGRIRTGHPRAR